MKLNYLQMKQQKHFYLTVLMKLSKNWNSEWLILKCSYKVQKNKEPYRLLACLFVAFSSNCKHFASTENGKPHKYWLPAVFTSFKLAESGLIQVILTWLSIPFCIDNSHFFHTLFFVSHIFSTNPVPLHFFIIVCSSGGLQVGLLFTK